MLTFLSINEISTHVVLISDIVLVQAAKVVKISQISKYNPSTFNHFVSPYEQYDKFADCQQCDNI